MPGNDYANLVDLEPVLSLPPSDIQMYIDSSAIKSANIEAQLNSFRDSDKDAFDAGVASVVPTYRFRGYYVVGMSYEFWTGQQKNTPNPSGNPLIDVTVDTVLSR